MAESDRIGEVATDLDDLTEEVETLTTRPATLPNSWKLSNARLKRRERRSTRSPTGTRTSGDRAFLQSKFTSKAATDEIDGVAQEA
jgi:hypothetical protein